MVVKFVHNFALKNRTKYIISKIWLAAITTKLEKQMQHLSLAIQDSLWTKPRVEKLEPLRILSSCSLFLES